MNHCIDSQKNKYRKNYLIHGDTPQGVFYNDKYTTNLRFNILLQSFLVEQNSFSLHDVGSGIGLLYEYIKDNTLEIDYSGSEIVPEMVKSMKKRFPEIKVYNRDIIDADENKGYDVLILAGSFNLLPENLNKQEWEKYCLKIIEKMFRLCNIGISFNFLTSYNTFTHDDLIYFDPKELFDFCMCNLSRFVKLDHGYPLYEGTITIFKEDYMKNKYARADELKKYFN